MRWGVWGGIALGGVGIATAVYRRGFCDEGGASQPAVAVLQPPVPASIQAFSQSACQLPLSSCSLFNGDNVTSRNRSWERITHLPATMMPQDSYRSCRVLVFWLCLVCARAPLRHMSLPAAHRFTACPRSIDSPVHRSRSTIRRTLHEQRRRSRARSAAVSCGRATWSEKCKSACFQPPPFSWLPAPQHKPCDRSMCLPHPKALCKSPRRWISRDSIGDKSHDTQGPRDQARQ